MFLKICPGAQMHKALKILTLHGPDYYAMGKKIPLILFFLAYTTLVWAVNQGIFINIISKENIFSSSLGSFGHINRETDIPRLIKFDTVCM